MSFFTGASSALEEALIQNRLEQRQRLLDEIKARQLAAEESDRKARLQLDISREARAAKDSQRNFDAAEQEREYRRASNLAATMLPGKSDAATFNALNKNGFAGVVQERPDLQLPTSLSADPGQGHVASAEAQPRVYESLGGSQYQNARLAEQARAEQAAAAAEAAAERQRQHDSDTTEQRRQHDEAMRAMAANKPESMILVDTVDPETGEHVKQIVPKRAGATFAQPEPAAVQSQRKFAEDALPSIARARQQLQDPAVMNGYGPASGRALGFLRGTVGSTGNPELDTKLAETKQTLNMIGSGAMKAHFGARGSTDIYNKLMDELGNAKSVASIVGTLNAIEARMHDYAHDQNRPKGGPAQGKSTKSLAQKYGLE